MPTDDIDEAYQLFKRKLKELCVSGLLQTFYVGFKKYWRRKTNWKGQWSIEQECERLFFSKEDLFKGIQAYLRVYDICSSFDVIEAKMETIGKDIKYMLVNMPNLDEAQFERQLILKDNLEKLGCNEKFVVRLVNVFLQFKKNRSPLVPKRKPIVSQVVDRYLYDEEVRELDEKETMKLVTELLKKFDK